MSIGVYVVGVRKKDDLWYKMANIKVACEVARVSLPKEVEHYFAYPEASLEDNWQEMHKQSIKGEGSVMYDDRFKFKVFDIPEDVEYIWVYAS